MTRTFWVTVVTLAAAVAQPVSQSGLDPEDLAAIRKLAAPVIMNLDKQSVRERGQVFLVAAGNNHCPQPYVVAKSNDTWTLVWTTPDPRSIPREIRTYEWNGTTYVLTEDKR